MSTAARDRLPVTAGPAPQQVERSLTEALAPDPGFDLAGYVALLRAD